MNTFWRYDQSELTNSCGKGKSMKKIKLPSHDCMGLRRAFVCNDLVQARSKTTSAVQIRELGC